MKQQISKEQWDELNYKEKIFLKQWDTNSNITKRKLFTIGEMLEYLRDNYSQDIPIQIVLDEDYGCSIVLLFETGEARLTNNQIELCDLLWEAVKKNVRGRDGEI